VPKDLTFHALAATRPLSGPDPLMAFLKDARSTAVTLSARDVQRLESYRLQILLAAQKQWQADDRPFRVTDISPGFAAGLERLGLPAHQFDPLHPDTAPCAKDTPQ